MPKYNSYDNIPAKVFFKILETKDYQLLRPKPKEEGLEKIFYDIYDLWFLNTDNDRAKDYLRVRNELAVLHNNYRGLDLVLRYIFNNKGIMTNEMYLELIEAIKIGYNVFFNVENNYYEEMKRVLHVELGGLKDDISFKEVELENFKMDGESKFNYYAIVDSISNVLAPRIINSEMLLPEFVEAEKSAIRKSLKKTA